MVGLSGGLTTGEPRSSAGVYVAMVTRDPAGPQAISGRRLALVSGGVSSGGGSGCVAPPSVTCQKTRGENSPLQTPRRPDDEGGSRGSGGPSWSRWLTRGGRGRGGW